MPIGFCGLVHPNGQAEAELKYAFHRTAWGRGLGREVAAGMLAYGLQALHLPSVIATVETKHAASRRVLEAIGMRLREVQDQEATYVVDTKRHSYRRGEELSEQASTSTNQSTLESYCRWRALYACLGWFRLFAWSRRRSPVLTSGGRYVARSV